MPVRGLRGDHRRGLVVLSVRSVSWLAVGLVPVRRRGVGWTIRGPGAILAGSGGDGGRAGRAAGTGTPGRVAAVARAAGVHMV
jgi:hypothetical protein